MTKMLMTDGYDDKEKGYFHQKVFFTASPIHERRLRASSIFRGKKLGVGKWLLQLMTIFLQSFSIHSECGGCAIVPFGDTIIIIGDTRDPRIKSLNHRLAKFLQKKREKTSSNLEGKTRSLKCQIS